MKVTATGKRIGLGCALLLAIAITVVGEDKSMLAEPSKPPALEDAMTAKPPASEAREKTAVVEMAKLSRVPPAADGLDVFAAKSWARPAMARVMVEPPPAQPVAPPMPFQFVGRIQGREGQTILLARGAESFSVRAGEEIDSDYRLDSVTNETLTIVYLPLNERQILDLDPK